MTLSWEQTTPVAKTVLPGGYWKPRDCLPRRRIAVIIPCRDREQQLRAFLYHMHPLMQRQLIEYRIFVAEQVSYICINKNLTRQIRNIHHLDHKQILSVQLVLVKLSKIINYAEQHSQDEQ
jgi:hypothetical protein